MENNQDNNEQYTGNTMSNDNRIVKTIKYRMLPNKKQENILNHWMDLAREIYNISIEQYIAIHEYNRQKYFDSLPEEERAKKNAYIKKEKSEIITPLKKDTQKQ